MTCAATTLGAFHEFALVVLPKLANSLVCSLTVPLMSKTIISEALNFDFDIVAF